jgi:hypothetical protein
VRFSSQRLWPVSASIMTKKVSSKRTREDLKPLLVPVKMQPYGDRIKLLGPSDPEQRKAVKVMTDILVKKKIPASEANQAVREARHAAAINQKARWYFYNHRANAANALKDLDELILKMAKLAEAISRLPPSSKGYLNQKAAHLVKEGVFDIDMIVDLINLLLDCLPDISPRKKADDVRCIIERHEGDNSPRIARLWESIPLFTRDCVERRIKSSPIRSCVELFRVLPTLLPLKDFRPTPPGPGAPRFLLRKYVKDIHRIWLRLDLTARRNYYVGSDRAGDKARHVQSPFQKFCNAALTSVGDPTKISNRQVSNLERGASPKGKPRQVIET